MFFWKHCPFGCSIFQKQQRLLGRAHLNDIKWAGVTYNGEHERAQCGKEETLWKKHCLASCVMILTQPNSPFSCTLYSHLAPCYCSLHLPSPPHSLTMETTHQEMCGSSSSPISWVTPLPSTNTLTCFIMLIKRKLLLPRDRGTRRKSEMSTPALSPSPGRWLSLGSPLSS